MNKTKTYYYSIDKRESPTQISPQYHLSIYDEWEPVKYWIFETEDLAKSGWKEFVHFMAEFDNIISITIPDNTNAPL